LLARLLVYGMAGLPMTLAYPWFSSTSKNTWATTGMEPLADLGSEALPPPQAEPTIANAMQNEILVNPL
jgi:hypothetical protein